MTEPASVKFGALLWPQYTDWPALRDAAILVDELGFQPLWTWDHLDPIVGDPAGPIFEGYLTLANWAAITKRVSLGLMVGANTFRNPAIVAKMATTLDHMSTGRAVLGLGGAWFEAEHEAYGIDFGSGFGERLDRLDEAAGLIRSMLDGAEPTLEGRFYRSRSLRNAPPPVQPRLPILIGGGGEKKTLATVARYADMWNVRGTVEEVRHKDGVLRRWCAEVGRDSGDIERTLEAGWIVIRDDLDAGQRIADEIARTNRTTERPMVGTPETIAEHLRPYLDAGFRHLYFNIAAPFDRETIERLVTDVRPLLEPHTAPRAATTHAQP